MSEPIQVPMPGAALPVLMKQGGKKEYSLSEFGALIDPVYRVYSEQIHRCISGLTSYAAQCAAAHHEEQIPDLRRHILMMASFWSMEEDPSVNTDAVAEQEVGRPFDAAIAEARRTGTAPPLTEQAMKDILTGLEVHVQEMDNSGGLEYPEREEWPTMRIVCVGGRQQPLANAIDADGLDMAVIRENGERFMARPEVRPVWAHELTIPVEEPCQQAEPEPEGFTFQTM